MAERLTPRQQSRLHSVGVVYHHDLDMAAVYLRRITGKDVLTHEDLPGERRIYRVKEKDGPRQSVVEFSFDHVSRGVDVSDLP